MNPKIGQLIVDVVNEETSLNLTFSRFSPLVGAVVAHNKKLKLHVIPFYGDLQRGWIIRGVVSPKTRNGPLSWFINGQVSKGNQLFHWAEGDVRAFPSIELLHEEWENSYGPNWKEKREIAHSKGMTYIMPYPKHLEPVTTP